MMFAVRGNRGGLVAAAFDLPLRASRIIPVFLR